MINKGLSEPLWRVKDIILSSKSEENRGCERLMQTPLLLSHNNTFNSEHSRTHQNCRCFFHLFSKHISNILSNLIMMKIILNYWTHMIDSFSKFFDIEMSSKYNCETFFFK